MIPAQVRDIVYVIAAVLFILDLKWMAHPRTAVRGNLTGAIGMGLAILVTLLSEPLEYPYLIIAAGAGALVGGVAAVRVKMTAMPEMVGLFNGFGGGASVLVAGSAMVAAVTAMAGATATSAEQANLQMKIATVASGIIGSVTFFGSYVAFGKLAEFLAVKWKLYTWQKVIKYGFSAVVALGGVVFAVQAGILPHGVGSNEGILSILVMLSALLIAGMLLLKKDRFPGMDALKIITAIAAVLIGVLVVMNPENFFLFWVLVGVAGVLGVLLTLSIGGADMPVVIALLNSYSGLAAAATGFVINNTVLIIAGSLVGASGIILTTIMCKAMNRSLANVLFATMGPTADTPDADEVYKTVKATSAEEIAMLLDGVQRVVVVPGYGMDVEYEKLREMDDINQEMEQIDVCIVLGANDVVNPVARTDPNSPIAGMPIIDVDKARTVIVIKRSLSPGFAGIPNPLFAQDNTLMFFNDGKKAVQDIVAAVKEAA
jgi:NAD(P) transhydrogenase subunit beta